jgi:hypothetical protein
VDNHDRQIQAITIRGTVISISLFTDYLP